MIIHLMQQVHVIVTAPTILFDLNQVTKLLPSWQPLFLQRIRIKKSTLSMLSSTAFVSCICTEIKQKLLGLKYH